MEKSLILSEIFIKYGKIFHCMDAKDRQILQSLEADASQSTKELAKKTRIPITTVHNRVQKLRKEGVIQKFTIKVDEAKRGFPLSAYILVSATPHSNQQEMLRKIRALSSTIEASIITGLFDLIIKAKAASMAQLDDLITKQLKAVEGVERTQTMMVLE